MLDELNSQEREQADAIRREWLDIATCTEPADRDSAEAAIRQIYEAAGHEAPTEFIWVDSPLAGVVFAAVVAGLVPDVRDPVWEPAHVLRGSTAEFVAHVRSRAPEEGLTRIPWRESPRRRTLPYVQSLDELGLVDYGPMYRALRLPFDSIWRTIGAATHWEFRALVAAGLAGASPELIAYPLRSPAHAALNDFTDGADGAGHHEPHLPFWSFLADAGVDVPPALPAFAELARAAGWWWAYEGLAVVTERPTQLSLDDTDALHNDGGTALEYRDGFELFAHHGRVGLPPKAVEDPASLSVEDIEQEPSTATRWALIEIYGADRYREDSERLRPRLRWLEYEPLPGVGGGQLPTRVVRLDDFVHALPYRIGSWSGRGFIPNIDELNELFRQGVRDAGMSGGARWKPFEIDREEFDALVDVLERQGQFPPTN